MLGKGVRPVKEINLALQSSQLLAKEAVETKPPAKTIAKATPKPAFCDCFRAELKASKSLESFFILNPTIKPYDVASISCTTKAFIESFTILLILKFDVLINEKSLTHQTSYLLGLSLFFVVKAIVSCR